jgi:predicted DNA-binding transcriptional regulator AlpA
MENRGAYRFEEWCERNGFTRAHGYHLLKTGRGPKTYKTGARRYVGTEADVEWRRRMEADTEAAERDVELAEAS